MKYFVNFIAIFLVTFFVLVVFCDLPKQDDTACQEAIDTGSIEPVKEVC